MTGDEVPKRPTRSSLALWLSADATLLTTGGKISQWMDQSENGNNAYMDSDSRQPMLATGTLGQLPVVRFSGAQSLFLTRALTSTQFTFFVVGKNNNPAEAVSSTDTSDASSSIVLGPSNTNPNNQLRWQNGTQVLLVGLENNLPAVKVTIGNTRIYHELSGRYDGSRLAVYRDGALMGEAQFTVQGTWSFNQIGAWYSLPRTFLLGDIAELFFYDSALSEPDRTLNDAYLQNKYCLP